MKKNLFKSVIAMFMCLSVMLGLAVNVSAGGDEDYIYVDQPYSAHVEAGNNLAVRFAPEADGWYRFYSVSDGDIYATLYNSDWDEIAYGDDGDDSFDFSIAEKLYSGYTYYLEMGAYLGGEGNIDFELNVERVVGVTDAEIITEPTNPDVIEDYEFESLSVSGLEVRFTLEDGTTVDWSYDEGDDVGGFPVDVAAATDGTGHYYIDITCGEAFTRFFYNTVESNIDHIEYVCDEDIWYYENTHGQFDTAIGYYIYQYNVPDTAKLIVHYKDGTTNEGSIHEAINGVVPMCYDDQISTQWATDASNFIEVRYLGYTTTVPVEIKESPFQSVTVDTVPTRNYYLGDFRFGGFISDEYYFTPSDLTGLSFTATLRDGTEQTFTSADFDTDHQLFEGYAYTISQVTASSIGTYQVTLNCNGYSVVYDIEVVGSPVASIEMITPPTKTEYEEMYYPLFEGSELKVVYKDHNEFSVKVTEENISYARYPNGFYYVIDTEYGDINASFQYSYLENREYYTFFFEGATLNYDALNFVPVREISAINLISYSGNIDGAKFEVEYENGDVEELIIDQICDLSASGDGYIKTENGISYIEFYEDVVDGELVGLQCYLLGGYYYFNITEGVVAPILYGDANGDAIVNSVDAAQTLKHDAFLITLEGDALLAADVNGDGEVNSLDAALVLKYDALLIEEFPVVQGE